MASGARAILSTFSVRQLKDLAAQNRVATDTCKSKADYVKRLASTGSLARVLESPAFQVRPILVEKSAPELLNLAAQFGIDVAGLEKKADLVDRIAASPAAAKILEMPAGPERAEAKAATPPKLSDLSHPTGDHILQQGRNIDADFGLAEDILDQARMRFEERAFDRVLELAHEALLLVHGTLDAFERSAWAYALLASQKLIEESGRVGRDVEPAAAMLRDAKVSYVSGNLAANRDLLIRLQAATKALYSEEVQRLRKAIYAAEDKVQQAALVGSDVAAAEEALTRARDAMQRAEHARALELLAEAERLAGVSLEQRVKEIGGAIPSAARVIDEAATVGAETGEAIRLLEKAKVAVERQEYVLASELVQRAERSALQAQHFQIQKAMELRVRQIEKAQGIVDRVVPILDEAASYDLDIDEARRVLQDAREVLDHGDYVNGTILAKKADELALAFVPKLVADRPKHGIVKPVAGRCDVCGSQDVVFMDDGWSRCNACVASWRWRVPSGLWEKFRSLLRE